MMNGNETTAVAETASDSKPGPWRITFDTNPDDCNLHCIMCEDHSPFSTTQSDRISAGPSQAPHGHRAYPASPG